MGAMFFAVFAVAAQLDRNYIREKTLEGQHAAANKGNHGGRPKVIDDDMLLFARALKDKGVPVPSIAKKLTIKTGKNAGQHPSVASVYRALAEAEETDAPAGPDIIAPHAAEPGGPHRSRQRNRPRADGTPHPASPQRGHGSNCWHRPVTRKRRVIPAQPHRRRSRMPDELVAAAGFRATVRGAVLSPL